MPTFDLSPPPSKRRKITTTYGTPSVFSRALRAVREVVPSSIVTLSNAPLEISQFEGEEATAELNKRESNHRPTDIDRKNGHSKKSPSSRSNHESYVETVEAALGDKGPSESRKGNLLPPGDKKNNFNSPLKKKRNYNNSRADSNEVDELQAANGSAKGLLPRLRSPIRPQEAPDSDTALGSQPELRDTQNSVRLNSKTAEKTNGERSSRRLRGKRSGSLELGIKTKAESTPRQITEPESLLRTSRGKIGRPRKYPKATPPPNKDEENDLGFTAIPSGYANPTRSGLKTSEAQKPVKENTRSFLKRNAASKRREATDVIIGDRNSRSPNQRAGQAVANTESPGHGDEDGTNRKPLNVPSVPENLKKSTLKLQRLLESSSSASLNSLQTNLLQVLTGRKSLPLINLNEESSKIHQLVSQTVLAGEGNSMLIIGPRGCGKTTLVESVVSDLSRDYSEDFITVRLNGFIHTDDKLALREIWRQLGREMEVEDDVIGARSNYADTLSSLLALLSHSPEFEESQELETSRSVIFVIDEFDLFAAHPRQTLLYNLFDIAQSRNAPIAVLGLTTRIDIVESLEKRVKSRFGQRYVNLAYPRTLETFRSICKAALVVEQQGSNKLSVRFENAGPEYQNLRIAWNSYIEHLFDQDAVFQQFLLHLYTLNKSVATFLSSALLPITFLSPSNIPTGASFASHALLPPDSSLHLLESLSDLELSLLVSAARLDVILDSDVCNFHMAFEEYVQLASRVKVQSSAAGQSAVGGGARIWGRQVARGAWERLIKLGLLFPANVGTKVGGDGGMWRVDVALEEIPSVVAHMSTAMSKWCREI